MGTPVSQGMSLDEFLKQRRRVLESQRDTIKASVPRTPVRDTSGLTVPQESTAVGNLTPSPETGNVGPREFIRGVIGDVLPEEVNEILRNIEAGAERRREEFGEPTDINPGIMELVAPGGAGLGSAAGRAGVLRRSIASRPKAGEILKKLPEVADDVAALGGRFYDAGVNMWNATLKGMNPGQFGRTLAQIPERLLPEFRMGMLEGLRENLANMTRLTKAAQKNLLSPAGRAMLRETLSEMPEEAFEALMKYLEKGQFQEWRNRAFIIAMIYPSLRFIGAPIWETLTGKR